jgi:predicted metal-dependent phosphoesterase TrpH
MNGLLTTRLEHQPIRRPDGRVEWSRLDGKRVDLHCHSSFSDEYIRWLPGLLFHPLLDPWELYDCAKSRGMDFVTITDHDTIAGCLALLDRRGPLPDFIVGEEVSVSFPDDGTVVHVNVYDVDEAQHAEIQRLRGDIRDFVSYLTSIDKLFVLNHMTWTQQHRALTGPQIELMLDLFPVFEGLNGTRSYAHNAFTWHATQGRGKVLVAGSDSHTNRIGSTYTLSAGDSARDLLANIRAGNALPCGAFGTPEQLRDDVWITLQKNVERHYLATTNGWMRAACHVIEQIGRLTSPFICLGYHTRQNLLIRKSLAAIPTV